MEISDGREQQSSSFKFADFYAAVTASLPPASKRKTHNPLIGRRWSSTARFFPWISRCIARFGRDRSGAGASGSDDSTREIRREKATIVSLIDKRVKEKLDR
jgi:hypothetical protein